MIPQLKRCLECKTERNNDLEYTAANYIYWAKTRDNNPKIGYGICSQGGFYDYVTYVYKVTLTKEPTIEVFIGKPGSGPIRIIWTKIEKWSERK